jgi:hypothetical protein
MLLNLLVATVLPTEEEGAMRPPTEQFRPSISDQEIDEAVNRLKEKGFFASSGGSSVRSRAKTTTDGKAQGGSPVLVERKRNKK